MSELFIFYAHQVDKIGCMQICGAKQNSQPVEKEGLSDSLQLPCMCGKHYTHARCEGIAGMTVYYTPEMVKLVVKGMSQELKPETLQKELRGVLNVGVQHQTNFTAVCPYDDVVPRPTPYMLQMAQVPVMNNSGAKQQTQRGQCLSPQFIVTFESQRCIFIIFNFQLFCRSNVTRCCWLPWWSD